MKIFFKAKISYLPHIVPNSVLDLFFFLLTKLLAFDSSISFNFLGKGCSLKIWKR